MGHWTTLDTPDGQVAACTPHLLPARAAAWW